MCTYLCNFVDQVFSVLMRTYWFCKICPTVLKEIVRQYMVRRGCIILENMVTFLAQTVVPKHWVGVPKWVTKEFIMVMKNLSHFKNREKNCV